MIAIHKKDDDDNDDDEKDGYWTTSWFVSWKRYPFVEKAAKWRDGEKKTGCFEKCWKCFVTIIMMMKTKWLKLCELSWASLDKCVHGHSLNGKSLRNCLASRTQNRIHSMTSLLISIPFVTWPTIHHKLIPTFTNKWFSNAWTVNTQQGILNRKKKRKIELRTNVEMHMKSKCVK